MACRGLRARAALSIAWGGLGGWSVALMEEVGLLDSLTIRGWSLRDCG